MSIGNLPAVPAPTSFTCGKCGSYPMGKETVLRVYRHQGWFNHFTTVCPKCKRDYTIWRIPIKDVQYMMVNNTKNKADCLNVEHYDFCDDVKVIRAFCIDNNKAMPEDRWLSPRAIRHIDNQVGFWAYLLDHIEPPAGK